MMVLDQHQSWVSRNNTNTVISNDQWENPHSGLKLKRVSLLKLFNMVVLLQLFDLFCWGVEILYHLSWDTAAVFYNAFDRFNGRSHMTASGSIHLTGWQSSLSTFKSTLISLYLITKTALRSQSVMWPIPLETRSEVFMQYLFDTVFGSSLIMVYISTASKTQINTLIQQWQQQQQQPWYNAQLEETMMQTYLWCDIL